MTGIADPAEAKAFLDAHPEIQFLEIIYTGLSGEYNYNISKYRQSVRNNTSNYSRNCKLSNPCSGYNASRKPSNYMIMRI